MPTDTTSAFGSASHEEASRRALIDRAMGINTKGHDVLDAEGRVVATGTDLKKHEESTPELLNPHSSQVTKYAIHLFGLVCVYILDVLLFGGTAEYVVSLITGNPILVVIGKYGIPLAFLGIEVLCALKINEALNRNEEDVPHYGW